MYIVKEKEVIAFCLGAGSDAERRLLDSGALRRHADGSYEVFSREATEGVGQRAMTGDYCKTDESGFPYPNEKIWFESCHTHLGGDRYLQRSGPFFAWTLGDPPCPVMDFLTAHGRLTVAPDDPERCFSALLWSAPLTAAADAVVVFYRIDTAENGTVTDVEFNFVERSEFERSYRIL